MMYGPMQLLVISFPHPDVPMDLRNQLKRVREQGLVRMVDAIFVSKDDHADLAILEGSDLDEDEAEFLGVMARAFFGYGAAGDAGFEAGIASGMNAAGHGVFGMKEGDLLEIADAIPVGSAALFLLLEHVWAKGLKDAAENGQGTVVANGWITPETLVAMGASEADYVL